MIPFKLMNLEKESRRSLSTSELEQLPVGHFVSDFFFPCWLRNRHMDPDPAKKLSTTATPDQLVSFPQQWIGNCQSPMVCYARPWLVTKVWAKAHHVPRCAAAAARRWAELQPFLGSNHGSLDHLPQMAKLSAVSSQNQVQKRQTIGNLFQGSPSELTKVA